MLKQFHHMNAYTYTCADGSELFYSYETRIAEWHPAENKLYIGQCWRCSRTTINQLSRWLRETGKPEYTAIKKALTKSDTAELDGINIKLVFGYPFEFKGHPYALAY